MNITWKIAIKVAKALVGPMIKVITPILRENLEGFLTKEYVQAMATENPWDDMLYLFLLEIFEIPIPEGST